MLRRAFVAFLALLLPVAVVLATDPGGSSADPAARTVVVPAPASRSGPSRAPGLNVAAAASRALERHAWDVAVWTGRVDADRRAAFVWQAALDAAAVRPRPLAPSGTVAPGPAPAAVAPSRDLSSVVQCIKDHESGNYAESSHPGSGSGAFQFIPGTWRHYFGLWRDQLPPLTRLLVPIYDLAYQAPAWVQDAVLNYALTHGGAGNWSPRYGNDPCTVGMGG